jgi:hypothetical protein
MNADCAENSASTSAGSAPRAEEKLEANKTLLGSSRWALLLQRQSSPTLSANSLFTVQLLVGATYTTCTLSNTAQLPTGDMAQENATGICEI